jgi:hypothetical protein
MPKHTRRRGRSLNRNNRFRRTNRRNNGRARSLPPQQNVKSREIDFGGFGVVSRPPARCGSFITRNFNENAFREVYAGDNNYISKLTEFYSASKELNIGIAIKERIPEYYYYYCLVEFICNAPEKKSIERNGDYYGTYAISPYCGITLANYFNAVEVAPFSKFELYHSLPMFQNLVYGLLLLHDNNIVHQDIHDKNILYEKEYGILRLIDFGLAVDFNKNNHNNPRTNNNPLNINDPKFINAKLLDLEKLIDNIILPYLDRLLQYRNTIPNDNAKLFRDYPELEEFLSNIRELNGRYDRYKNPFGKTSYVRVNTKEKLNRLMTFVNDFRELPSLDVIAKYIAQEKAEFNAAAKNNNNK